MALSTLEAYDLVRFAEHLSGRLEAAQAELSQKRALKAEKDWMAAAAEALRLAREPAQGLLERVRNLPELAEVRDEFALVYQNEWVDLLEKLVAGVTFHAGPRDPIIEALFPHQKFPVLRRDRETAEDYAKDFERRLKSAYVARIFGQDSYAFARPVLEQLTAARAKWQSAFGEGGAPSDEEAEALRKDLVAAAKRIEPAIRQAKLLAEAALVPCAGMFEELGLAAKPKKRNPPKARAEKDEAAEVPEASPVKAADEQPAEAKAPEKKAQPAEEEKAAKKKKAAAPAEPEAKA